MERARCAHRSYRRPDLVPGFSRAVETIARARPTLSVKSRWTLLGTANGGVRCGRRRA
jgi:hypothetical protein